MTNNHPDSADQLERTFGFRLPHTMRTEFNQLIRESAKQHGHTLNSEELHDVFCREYIDNTTPYELSTINFEKEFVNTERERLCCHAVVKKNHKTQEVKGCGNGTLNALLNAFKVHFGVDLEVMDYLQHGLTQGSHAFAASYIQAHDPANKIIWGVGIDSDSTLSAVRAMLSAINRSLRE